MAKGALFTVFSDSAPVPVQSTSSAGNVNKSRRALGGASASGQHRALGSVLSDENGSGSSWRGKENFDPFAPTVLSAKALSKGKSTSSSTCSAHPLRAPSAKASGPLAPKPRPFRLGPAPPSASNGVGSGTLQPASAAAGICSGSVRVRTVPSSTWGGRSPKKATAAGGGGRTRPAELRLKPQSVAVSRAVVELAMPSPSASESSVMSRASSKDSGYASGARSVASEDASEGEEGMSADETAVVSEGYQAFIRPSVHAVGCCAGPETLGDRRARGLTESPLAELTAAFAASANFSPSPSPLAHGCPPASGPFAKLSTARSPTAPAKQQAARTTRMRPYAPTSPSKEARQPRAALGGKALRF